MMKIALIYPGITVNGFAGEGRRPKTGWIHHGLCSISAVLKNAGHDVCLNRLSGISYSVRLRKKIDKFRVRRFNKRFINRYRF